MYLNLWTAHYISYSIGTESSTWKGSTDMGILYNVGAKLLYHLHHEPQGCPVEHRHSAAVSDRRIRSNGTLSGRPVGVYYKRKIYFLEDSQFQVGMVHPPHLLLESSATAILYVIGFVTNRRPGFVPSLAPLPPPRCLPRTTAHYLSTETFSPPVPPATL